MRGMLYILFVIFLSVGAQATQIKEWTILVFISGHNDLDIEGELDIKEMERVGSNDDINVVVQRGTLEGNDTLRYYIEKSTHSTQITSPVIEQFPRVDMGDYKELIKFINWGVKNYPAKKYFIDVWNHGSGWHSVGDKAQFLQFKNAIPSDINDIGYDDLTGNKITTEQMGTVMKHFAKLIGRKIELYGSDACLMAMVEVAAEMSDYVNYFVGSQEDEPAHGWPYHLFLQKLSKNPTAGGDAAGVMLAQSYKTFYEAEGNEMGTTFSVWDLSYLDSFMESVSLLTESLISMKAAAIKKAYNLAVTTERFSFGDYKDFFHFFDKIKKEKTLELDNSAVNNIENVRNKLIVYNVSDNVHPNANGVSIWLPTYQPDLDSELKRYKGLEFDKKTKWSKFVSSFIQ